MKIFNLVVLVVLCGCAYNRPVLKETVTVSVINGNTNVITERLLTMRSYVLWPATSALDKQKASMGKTLSAGTEGLGQESGGTNVVAALHELNTFLQTVTGK